MENSTHTVSACSYSMICYAPCYWWSHLICLTSLIFWTNHPHCCLKEIILIWLGSDSPSPTLVQPVCTSCFGNDAGVMGTL